jgi:hypothetical protein
MKLRIAARILAILLIGMLIAGCRQNNIVTNTSVQITMAVEPATAVVGEATIVVTLTDEAGQTINGAQVTVRGDMNQAGMEPVIRDTSESADGVYRLPFEWTMGGDWIVTVTAELPDGTIAEETFELSVGS